jgi:hypothetical protein
MHHRGLQLGLYLTYGKRTCMGYAGTWTKEDMRRDAHMLAQVGADYLKFDGCFNDVNTLQEGLLGKRYIYTTTCYYLSVCNNGGGVEEHGREYCVCVLVAVLLL